MSCKIRVFKSNLSLVDSVQHKSQKMLNFLSNDIYCLCKTQSFEQQAANIFM